MTRQQPMKIVKRPPGLRGFTLIELLVVVSIIALLVSILLPALGKAREQAKTVVCSSRLQQSGVGFAAYAADYGFLPCPGEWRDVNGDGTLDGFVVWQFHLQPYIPGGRGGRTYEIVHCPSVPLEIAGPQVPEGSSTYSFGMNILLNAKNSPTSEANLKMLRNPGRIRLPGEAILVADTIAKDRGVNWVHPYGAFTLMSENYPVSSYATQGEQDLRHNNKRACNTLYVDSHVSSGVLPYSDDISDPDGNPMAWRAD